MSDLLSEYSKLAKDELESEQMIVVCPLPTVLLTTLAFLLSKLG